MQRGILIISSNESKWKWTHFIWCWKIQMGFFQTEQTQTTFWRVWMNQLFSFSSNFLWVGITESKLSLQQPLAFSLQIITDRDTSCLLHSSLHEYYYKKIDLRNGCIVLLLLYWLHGHFSMSPMLKVTFVSTEWTLCQEVMIRYSNLLLQCSIQCENRTGGFEISCAANVAITVSANLFFVPKKNMKTGWWWTGAKQIEKRYSHNMKGIEDVNWKWLGKE